MAMDTVSQNRAMHRGLAVALEERERMEGQVLQVGILLLLLFHALRNSHASVLFVRPRG